MLESQNEAIHSIAQNFQVEDDLNTALENVDEEELKIFLDILHSTSMRDMHLKNLGLTLKFINTWINRYEVGPLSRTGVSLIPELAHLKNLLDGIIVKKIAEMIYNRHIQVVTCTDAKFALNMLGAGSRQILKMEYLNIRRNNILAYIDVFSRDMAKFCSFLKQEIVYYQTIFGEMVLSEPEETPNVFNLFVYKIVEELFLSNIDVFERHLNLIAPHTKRDNDAEPTEPQIVTRNVLMDAVENIKFARNKVMEAEKTCTVRYIGCVSNCDIMHTSNFVQIRGNQIFDI